MTARIHFVTDRLTGQITDQHLTQQEAVRLTDLMNEAERIQGGQARYVAAFDALAFLKGTR